MRSRTRSTTRRPTSIAAAVLLGSLLPACGGSPTRPASTPGATPQAPPLTAIDGITGAAVQAGISSTNATRTLTAAGYLPRETTQLSGPAALWPIVAGTGYDMSESYITQMVYSYGDTAATFHGRLQRWQGPIAIGLAEGLAGDAEAEATLDRTIASVASLPRVSISRSATPNVTFSIGVTIDTATGPALAVTRGRLSGSTMVGAEVVFRDRQAYLGLGRGTRPNTPLHEMGHVLGLGHSDRVSDVMNTAASDRNPTWQFGGDETALLIMMYAHRLPGNAPPDRDPGLTAAERQPSVVTIRCGG